MGRILDEINYSNFALMSSVWLSAFLRTRFMCDYTGQILLARTFLTSPFGPHPKWSENIKPCPEAPFIFKHQLFLLHPNLGFLALRLPSNQQAFRSDKCITKRLNSVRPKNRGELPLAS